MRKLWATIIKDCIILTRDKMGLTMMFLMPIILAIVIASVQNSTFELVNDNKIQALVLNNDDKGQPALDLKEALQQTGIFKLTDVTGIDSIELKNRINTKDALIAIVIPKDYSAGVQQKAAQITHEALAALELEAIEDPLAANHEAVQLYFHPVLQQSFLQSIHGALQSSLQLIQSKYIVQQVYQSINDATIPQSLEAQIAANNTPVDEIVVAKNHRVIPNATQHNIPAWTIFAMFFIVISLGSSVVREKKSGSIIRLRTLPTHFGIAMVAKQITYVAVTILQAAVIFMLGMYLFPKMGLPALALPTDIGALLLVTFICGWCAASFAIAIGVYAQTQEQANGFGAVFVVLLAAIGGLIVPSFVMPDALQKIMQLSPLHWCLEAYYSLFLQGGNLQDIALNLMPLLAIIVLLQLAAFIGLKKQHLI